MCNKKEIGNLGEDIACRHLESKGFSIVDRNYLKKWGEIDIVAEKGAKKHFVEVKTVSCENIGEVSYQAMDRYRPEDNVHDWKLKRMTRVIQSYLLEKDWEGEWQFDVVAVYLDVARKKAKVEVLEDLVL